VIVLCISKNIRALRESKGLSQDDLADLLGMTQQAVDAWERAISNPRKKTIDKLALIFNVSPNDIFGGAANRNNVEMNPDTILTSAEISFIKKYRALDARGKASVDETLEREYGFVAPKDEDEAM
jgi:transcriptional regulator with XRE-family HTH domain